VELAREIQRDCAVGHLDGTTESDCGIMDRVAACGSACVDRTIPADDPDDGFASCGGVTEVIATYLDP
jgi:hypothetical protein